MRKITLPTLLALLAIAPAGAAGKYYGLWWDGTAEHFVSLDPYTAAKTDLGVIPGVKYIQAGSQVFDSDSSRYAFGGQEAGGDKYYYVIDATTGTLITRVPQGSPINGAIYSPEEQKLFGVAWNAADSTEYFLSVDPFAPAIDSVAIPGVAYTQLNSSVYDADSARYAFAGMETGGGKYYYVVNARTGSLLAKIPQTESVNNLAYNPSSRQAHGLWWNGTAEYFVSVNTLDSTHTSVAIPGVKYTSTQYAFDTDSNRYVFLGMETQASQFWYVIDASSGTVVSKTAVADKIDNLAYCRSWAAARDSSFHATSVRPAPGNIAAASSVRSFRGFTLVEFANEGGKPLSFTLYDMHGRTALRRGGIMGNQVRLESRDLKSGAYFFEIRDGRSLTASGKLLLLE